jgi:hypothetical protein
VQAQQTEAASNDASTSAKYVGIVIAIKDSPNIFSINCFISISPLVSDSPSLGVYPL